MADYDADQEKEDVMRKKADQVAKQISDLEQQLGKLVWQEMSLQQACDDRKAHVAKLEADTARAIEMEEAARKAREECGQHEKTVHEYQQRNHDFQKAIEREREYETELARKLAAAHKENHEVRQQIEEAARAGAQLKQQLEALQKHNASLRQDTSNVQKEVVASQQILAAARQELGIIESQIAAEFGRRKEPLGVPSTLPAKITAPRPEFRLVLQVKNADGSPAGGEKVPILSADSNRILGTATADSSGQIDTPVAEQDVVVVIAGLRHPVRADQPAKTAKA